MESVLFQDVPPAVGDLIEERRRTGDDRFDEIWDGVYVVNPPPSFGHSSVAAQIVDCLRPGAEECGLVVRWEVGIGGPSDHRIPDVVVAHPEDVEDAGHYLRTAAVAVEVLSPNERLDKRPFYLAHSVDEVVIVDPAKRTVTWYVVDPATDRYQPADGSAILPVNSADLLELLTG